MALCFSYTILIYRSTRSIIVLLHGQETHDQFYYTLLFINDKIGTFAYSQDHQLLSEVSFSLKWVLAFVFFPLKFIVFFNVASPHKWVFCRFNSSPVARVFILSKSKVSAEFLFLFFFHTLVLVEIYMAFMCSWHFIFAYDMRFSLNLIVRKKPKEIKDEIGGNSSFFIWLRIR